MNNSTKQRTKKEHNCLGKTFDASFQEHIINEAVECLMKKYAEMNSGEVMPSRIPKFDANKFIKVLEHNYLSIIR